jgi:hypothetical protein
MMRPALQVAKLFRCHWQWIAEPFGVGVLLLVSILAMATETAVWVVGELTVATGIPGTSLAVITQRLVCVRHLWSFRWLRPWAALASLHG